MVHANENVGRLSKANNREAAAPVHSDNKALTEHLNCVSQTVIPCIGNIFDVTCRAAFLPEHSVRKLMALSRNKLRFPSKMKYFFNQTKAVSKLCNLTQVAKNR
ncbi:hypothetical protein T09_3767 [Trichinella sp. T9]|nr:hypothetical protein T09_3767 [Trichinella sp. T9]